MLVLTEIITMHCTQGSLISRTIITHCALK